MNDDVKWAYMISFYDLRYINEDEQNYTFVYWSHHKKKAVPVLFDKTEHNGIIFEQLARNE